MCSLGDHYLFQLLQIDPLRNTIERVHHVVGAMFTFVGYIFYKLGCEPAPLLLGFILGPMMEENLRRALLLSRGDWTTFMTRPLSAGLLLAAVLMIVVVMLPSIQKKREDAFHDAD